MMKSNTPIVSTRILLPGEIQISDESPANAPGNIKLPVAEISDFAQYGNIPGNIPDSRYPPVNAIPIISATNARVIKMSDRIVMRSFD